jgi:hypothetical protein
VVEELPPPFTVAKDDDHHRRKIPSFTSYLKGTCRFALLSLSPASSSLSLSHGIPILMQQLRK